MAETLNSAVVLSGSWSGVPSMITLPVAGVPVSSVTLLVSSTPTGGSLTRVTVMVPLSTLESRLVGPPALVAPLVLLPSLSTTV